MNPHGKLKKTTAKNSKNINVPFKSPNSKKYPDKFPIDAHFSEHKGHEELMDAAVPILKAITNNNEKMAEIGVLCLHGPIPFRKLVDYLKLRYRKGAWPTFIGKLYKKKKDDIPFLEKATGTKKVVLYLTFERLERKFPDFKDKILQLKAIYKDYGFTRKKLCFNEDPRSELHDERNIVQQKNQETHDLQENVNELSTQLSELSSQVKILENTKYEALSYINANIEEFGRTEKRVRKLRHERDELTAQITALQQELHDLPSQIDQLKSEKQELLLEKSDLQAIVSDLFQQFLELNDSLEQLDPPPLVPPPLVPPPLTLAHPFPSSYTDQSELIHSILEKAFELEISDDEELANTNSYALWDPKLCKTRDQQTTVIKIVIHNAKLAEKPLAAHQVETPPPHVQKTIDPSVEVPRPTSETSKPIPDNSHQSSGNSQTISGSESQKVPPKASKQLSQPEIINQTKTKDTSPISQSDQSQIYQTHQSEQIAQIHESIRNTLTIAPQYSTPFDIFDSQEWIRHRKTVINSDHDQLQKHLHFTHNSAPTPRKTAKMPKRLHLILSICICVFLAVFVFFISQLNSIFNLPFVERVNLSLFGMKNADMFPILFGFTIMILCIASSLSFIPENKHF